MSFPRPRVRIVLPAYNEELSLETSLTWLHTFCTASLQAYDWNLLIVNNGSKDATGSEAARLAKKFTRVTAMHLNTAGRGGALRQAAAMPGADYLVYMDVDMSTELDALPRTLEALDRGADLVVGSRLHPASRTTRRLYRELLSRGYNLLLRAILQTKAFRDAQCGFKAMRLQRLWPLIDRVQDRGWFFDTELLVLAEYNGLKLVEIPVKWIEDPCSKVDIPAAIAQYLLGMLRLKLTTRRFAP